MALIQSSEEGGFGALGICVFVSDSAPNFYEMLNAIRHQALLTTLLVSEKNLYICHVLENEKTLEREGKDHIFAIRQISSKNIR